MKNLEIYIADDKPLDMNEDESTKEKVEHKNRRQIRQLLRAAFADASSDPSSPREGDLNHFSHRHPLLRLYLQKSEGINCKFCNIVISGRGYACELEHCDYYLHEVCSNFPREIRHDFHPGYDHTLMLRPFQATGDQFHCAACAYSDPAHSQFHSYYCCESCSFNLHVECASIPITLNQKVKYPLQLFFSFPITSEAATLFCSICAEAVPASGCWLFYNHDHDFLCHFECAGVTEYEMENDSMGELQTRLQALALTTHPHACARRSCGDVTHFSHRHALKEYKSDTALSCNMCNFAFSTGYICGGCNYFIDEICFSIPTKIQHISHPKHPLKLTCYLDFQNVNIECPGCQSKFKSGRSRAYYCAPCKFIINRQCAGAPETLTLADNLSYKLIYSFPFRNETAEIKCNICSEKVVAKDGLLYYNRERDEALHVNCAIEKESCKDSAKMDMLSIQRLRKLRVAD